MHFTLRFGLVITVNIYFNFVKEKSLKQAFKIVFFL